MCDCEREIGREAIPNLNLSTVCTVHCRIALYSGEYCASMTMSPSHTANISSIIMLPSHRHGVYMRVVHTCAAQSQLPRPIATDRSRWHDGTSRLCSRNTTRGPCRQHDTTMRFPQALHYSAAPPMSSRHHPYAGAQSVLALPLEGPALSENSSQRSPLHGPGSWTRWMSVGRSQANEDASADNHTEPGARYARRHRCSLASHVYSLFRPRKNAQAPPRRADKLEAPSRTQ